MALLGRKKERNDWGIYDINYILCLNVMHIFSEQHVGCLAVE